MLILFSSFSDSCKHDEGLAHMSGRKEKTPRRLQGHYVGQFALPTDTVVILPGIWHSQTQVFEIAL
jgi:hypothetical protein